MKIYRLHRRQKLPLSPKEAWEYCSTPTTLECSTPPFLRFEIQSELPDSAYSGAIIVYRIRAIAGIPMTWVTEVKQVNKPFMFVDEQRLGSFKFWHHQHRFHKLDRGVEIEDILHYAMPLGWVGRLLHWLIIRNRVRLIFDFRRDYLARVPHQANPVARNSD